MYRPPDSKIEFSDRFENFIDYVTNEGNEIIFLGDFNKNLLNDHRGRVGKFHNFFRF